MSDEKMCPNNCENRPMRWSRVKDVLFCDGDQDYQPAVQCWWCPVCYYSEIEEY